MIGEEEPIYLNLIVEILGVELETDLEDIENAMEESRSPLLVDRAAAARQNANFKSTGVDSKTTGVPSAHNSPGPSGKLKMTTMTTRSHLIW